MNLRLLLPLACVLGAACTAAAAAPASASIDAFNAALAEATRHMDSAATMRLWEDEGVTLLPDADPIAGKRAISRYLEDVLRSLADAHMAAFEMRCAGVEVAGDWATEWCEEHQKVDLAGGKPPFEGRGRMLLVLHKGGDGNWRLRREMWQRTQMAGAAAAPAR
jgi:ketosteroid isomerase-like protein